MQKGFDTWNIHKKEIEENMPTYFVNKREIWWCSLGVNVGSEQDGVGEYFERPVVVLRKLSATTFIILPLSTKKKLEVFQYEVVVNNTVAYVLLDQVKVVDIRRFLRRVQYMENSHFDEVVRRFKAIL